MAWSSTSNTRIDLVWDGETNDDRLSHNDGGRALQEAGGSCGESERRDFRLNSLQGVVKRDGED